MWRAAIACLALTATAGAEERRGPARWQQASEAPALARVWGVGAELYGVGATGTHRSVDGGATWSRIDQGGVANGVWGSSLHDIWVIRARTIHHSMDGAGEHWSTRTLPVSFGTSLEGMWGVDRERYVFGADRSDNRGVILHSHDGGTSWQREVVDIERVAGMWGASAKDVYAVGAGGAILHSTGDGKWRTVRAGGGPLEGVWGTQGAIYAVGANGTILFSADGKTWTPRTSGVKYTLSSIAGLSAKELYVGSADGAPLRSTDGIVWKAITALVPRGQVWASSSEHVVVASSEVHFFGASSGEAIVPPEVPDELKPLRTRFQQYPAARDLISIAANRLGGQTKLAPWLLSPGTPRLRIDSVKNCSLKLDTIKQKPSFTYPGTEIVLDLRCATPCSATVPRPTVTQHAKIVHGGQPVSTIEVTFEATPDLCSMDDPRATVAHDAVIAKHAEHVGQVLNLGLGLASNNSARIDAYARYLIDGGPSMAFRDEVAKLLDRPASWRGFFWNDAGVPTPPLATSVRPTSPDCTSMASTLRDLHTKGDEAMAKGEFARAFANYMRVLRCDSKVAVKAYLAACRAKEFQQARHLFRLIGRSNLWQICQKQGFDPRP